MTNKYLTKIAYDYTSRGTTPPTSPHVFTNKFKRLGPKPLVSDVKFKMLKDINPKNIPKNTPKKGSGLKTVVGLGIIGGAIYAGKKVKDIVTGTGQEPYGYQ